MTNCRGNAISASSPHPPEAIPFALLFVVQWIDEGGAFSFLLLLSLAPLGNAVGLQKVKLVKVAPKGSREFTKRSRTWSPSFGCFSSVS